MLPENIARAVKPWYRRIKPWQFSLRTLLVLMALASVVCWYYLLPKKHDEQLAGGYLVLQRQYRGVINPTAGGLLVRTDTNDGYWRIKDLDDRLLVNGHYDRDEEQGWWTMYHPNGRIAVQGKMRFGGRVGVWKVWSADGQLRSAVTHALRPGNRLASDFVTADSPNSMLQGLAKFWHPNGKLAAAGTYEQDKRTGKWEEWNERGELISSGEYIADRKQGPWQEPSGAGNQLQTQHYVNGLRKEQLAEQLQQLAERLEKGDVTQRLTLLPVAAELGQPAISLLERWARETASPDVQLAAIRGVARCGGSLSQFESALSALANSRNPHIVSAARWELFRQFRAQREQTLPLILAEIADQTNVSPQVNIDRLRELFVLDPPRRGAIFAALVSTVIAANESKPMIQLSGPGATPPALEDWQIAAVPYIAETLNDSYPDRRLAAVLLIRQMLQEKNEFVDNPTNPSFFSGKWRIPSTLAPLVARARADQDAAVKDQADHLDDVYYGGSAAGGGFGGGLF